MGCHCHETEIYISGHTSCIEFNMGTDAFTLKRMTADNSGKRGELKDCFAFPECTLLASARRELEPCLCSR